MRDYGVTSYSHWEKGPGRRIAKLPPELRHKAAHLYHYLTSNPSTLMAGIYYISLASVADATGMETKDEAREAFKALASIDAAHYDEESGTAWIPDMANSEARATQKKTGEILPKDNRHAHILECLERVKDSPFVEQFRERYGDQFHLSGITPAKQATSPRNISREEWEQTHPRRAALPEAFMPE